MKIITEKNGWMREAVQDGYSKEDGYDGEHSGWTFYPWDQGAEAHYEYDIEDDDIALMICAPQKNNYDEYLDSYEVYFELFGKYKDRLNRSIEREFKSWNSAEKYAMSLLDKYVNNYEAMQKLNYYIQPAIDFINSFGKDQKWEIIEAGQGGVHRMLPEILYQSGSEDFKSFKVPRRDRGEGEEFDNAVFSGNEIIDALKKSRLKSFKVDDEYNWIWFYRPFTRNGEYGKYSGRERMRIQPARNDW